MFMVLCRITAWCVRCFRYSELSRVFSCASPTCGKQHSWPWRHLLAMPPVFTFLNYTVVQVCHIWFFLYKCSPLWSWKKSPDSYKSCSVPSRASVQSGTPLCFHTPSPANDDYDREWRRVFQWHISKLHLKLSVMSIASGVFVLVHSSPLCHFKGGGPLVFGGQSQGVL